MQPKLLIADDEPTILNLLKIVLSGEGYSVVTASDGEAALNLFRAEPFDLVITDLQMPKMDGLQLTQALKLHDPDVVIIILTGHGSIENATTMLRSYGAYDYLSKPVDELDNFLITIQNALEHRRLQLANRDLIDRLRTTNARLERRVKERTRELAAARDELELRVKARTAELSRTNDQLQAEVKYRKKITRELSKREQQYRQLIGDIPDIVYRYSSKKGALYCSPQMEKILGYTAEDFERDPFLWRKAVHPDDIEGNMVAANSDSLRPQVGREYRVRDADGRWHWVYDRFMRVERLAGERIIEGMVTDITLRKVAEQARAESEKKYRELVENANEGIMVIQNGSLRYVNPKMAAILNQRPSDLVAKRIKTLIHAEDWAVVRKRNFQQLRGKREPYRITFRMCTKDAASIWVEANATLIPWEKKTAVLCMITDVSQRREMEQQLIQADKMISLGILVSGMAHEINNPNNFVLINAPILAETWQATEPILESYYRKNGDFDAGGLPYSEMRTEILPLFKGIEEGAQRISRIVTDLKNYARQESADMDQQIDLNKVVEGALRLTRPLVKKSTENFELVLDRELPLVVGNARKMEQVVVNLVQNACHALTDRSQKIVVSTAPAVAGGGCLIEVRDEGGGIPSSLLPRVMDPFFTTKRANGGTGLGLAVSNRIVSEHGGEIKVQSTVGAGTIFTLVLPGDKAVGSMEVLIVDDDPMLREILMKGLGHLGDYHLQEACNGVEACVQLGKNTPDAIVLDVFMPDMDGVELCRVIKKYPALTGVQVVVMTGQPQSKKISEIKAMGFEKILTKPILIAELHATLQALWGQGRPGFCQM